MPRKRKKKARVKIDLTADLRQNLTSSSEQVVDSFESEIEPISLPKFQAIDKSLRLLTVFRSQQLDKAQYCISPDLYSMSINNFCHDATSVIRFMKKEKQRDTLTYLAESYFNRNHPTGRLFLDAALIFIGILTASSELKLHSSTTVSVAVLIADKSKKGSFLPAEFPRLGEPLDEAHTRSKPRL